MRPAAAHPEIVMDFYWNDRTDPAYNLALEEIMAAQADAPFIMLWRNRPAVILGRNQNAYAEFDSAFAREHGIAAVRRMTGGGAVYHDLGNLNYTVFSFGTDADGRFADFASFAGPVLDALRSLGADAVFSGRNDILVGGRKVSGSAKRIHNGRVLFHGTLLFDVDLETMAAVLTPPQAKIEAKGVPSVRARVANLKEFLPDMDRESFRPALQRELLKLAGTDAPRPIPDNWMREAERTADERYRSWEWTFGASPDFTFTRTRRFPCGTVTARLDVRRGVIHCAEFTGDFFGASPVAELAEALSGCPHRAGALRDVLTRFEVGRCIAGLDAESLLSLLAP